MTKHLTNALIFLSLLSLIACGKEGKTGATEIPQNGPPPGMSRIPEEIDADQEDLDAVGSANDDLPLAPVSDLTTTENKPVLNALIGAADTEKFLAALAALDSPPIVQAMSNDLAKALIFLQLLTQKADEQARMEYAKHLERMAKEINELKKGKITKAKLRKLARKNRARMAGIVKRMLARMKKR